VWGQALKPTFENFLLHPLQIYGYFTYLLHVCVRVCVRYGDGAAKTVEENSSIFSLIKMR